MSTKATKKKNRKNYRFISEMPDGLRQYVEKLESYSTVINSHIDTFTSCLHGRLIANYPSDEQTIADSLTSSAKMITATVINNAVSSNWCEFFQELADGQKPSELADIQHAVIISLVSSFNWQITNYLPISITGRLAVKQLKCSSYKPSHVFSEKDYKMVETSPLEEAKRSARRYMDKQKGVRIDWQDKDGKNHTYIAVPSAIDGMEDWQTDDLYYRFTQENRTDEDGRYIDYCDMTNNEYFMTALNQLLMDGTITKRDYGMAELVLNGLSYEDVGRVMGCSKQYVGKRMLLVYVSVKDYILTDFDYEMGDMPADVINHVMEYYDKIESLED